MNEPAALTIREYLASLLPRMAKPGGDDMPRWPPDVFALSMSLLRRSGAYCEVLAQWPPVPLAGERRDWLRNIRRWAREWREAWAVGALPPPLENRWRIICAEMARPLSHLRDSQNDVSMRVLELCAVADEACSEIGPARDRKSAQSDRKFLFRADVLWNSHMRSGAGSTLCDEIDPSRARVLPRIHTPRNGLTIRSLSLYLALYPPEEMKPEFLLNPFRKSEAMNLLIVPWPFRVVPSQFRPAKRLEGEMRTLGEDAAFFTFEGSVQEREVCDVVKHLCEDGEREVGPIAGVVLPEGAINQEQLGRLSEQVNGEGRFLIAGAGEPTESGSNPAARHSVRYGSNAAKIALSRRQILSQNKHHRWKLDGSQIEQYGLGGILHPDRSWWEHIRIGDRTLAFFSPQDNLTMSVLICEDLARPDPVGDLVRAVGPDLVIALLMDGPQLTARWPGRYAMSLADDPGSSVLSITSYGMSKLSRPLHGSATDRSNVVALWKDRFSGAPVEIDLPEGPGGIVLSLAMRKTTERSADCRQKWTTCPVLAGIRRLRVRNAASVA